MKKKNGLISKMKYFLATRGFVSTVCQLQMIQMQYLCNLERQDSSNKNYFLAHQAAVEIELRLQPLHSSLGVD
jgi:hypothetical protein